MDLFEALKRRRATRTFRSDPVPESELERVLYAISRAPTASNRPYRHTLVVDDPRVIRAVKDIAPALLADPPVLLVIFTDLSVATDRTGPIGETSSLIDAGAAAQSAVLAATALGLDSQFAMVSSQTGIRTVLGLPDHCRVDVLLPIGFAAPRKPAVRAAAEANTVHHNQFGTRYRAG